MSLLALHGLLTRRGGGPGPDPGGDVLWEWLGDTLAGWNQINANNVIVPDDGAPESPSVQVNPSSVIWADTGINLGQEGITIECMLKVLSGSINLVDYRFGCATSGSGPFLRFDARGGGNMNLSTVSHWTAVTNVAAFFAPAVPDRWYKISIENLPGNTSLVYIDDQPMTYFGRAELAMTGSCVGLYGDGGNTGGRIDTVRVTAKPAPVPGLYVAIRVSVSAFNGGDRVSIQELELRETAGGPNVASPVFYPNQATSSTAFHHPNGAFDGNTTNPAQSWTSMPGDAAPWLRYNFIKAKAPRHARLLAERNNPTRGPRDFIIEGTIDGENWETLASFANVSGWANDVWQEFSW